MTITGAIAHLETIPILGQVDVSSIQTQISSALGADLGTSVLNLIKAILILFVGWLIAILAASLTKALLGRTSLDNKMAAWFTGGQSGREQPNVEKWVATAVFWLIFLFAVIAALQALNLDQVTAPLQGLLNQIANFLPKLGGALLLLGLAWLIATLVKTLVTRVLGTARLDERLNQQMGSTPEAGMSLTDTIANTLYWLVFLVFLPWILEALGLQTALAPVVGLLNDILAVLPNIFAAILIGAIGWVVAQIIRRVVTGFLAATGVDRVGAKFGISGATAQQSLSGILGTVVYILVLIPVAISALSALKIEAISGPAISMLEQILEYLPRVFIVGLILTLAFVGGKYLSEFVTDILTSFGFNNLFRWLGLPVRSTAAPLQDDVPSSGEVGTSSLPSTPRTPSEVAGIIVLVGVMLVATLAAVDILQIPALTAVVGGLLLIAGRFLIGLVIFALGLYFANLASNLITSSGGSQSQILAQAARIAIIIFSGAMALQHIGIAPDIVNLAFGLLLGAIAVALAISFGLGGRDAAGEQVREWLHSFKQRN